MTSSKSFRSFSTSILTAVGTAGLAHGLNLPDVTSGFGARLSHNLASAAVKTGVDSTLGQQDFTDSLATNLATAGVNTVAGYAAQKIGNAYKGKDPSLDYATHKLAHGALGAVLGAIVADDKAKGSIAGAIGAVASEMIAEAVLDNAQKVFENTVEETAAKGKKLSQEEFTSLYNEQVNAQSAANWGKIGGALVSLLAEQDVKVSIQTATNAVENNLIPMVIGIGFMAWEAYDLYHTYQEEGPEAALKKLGFTIGTAIVGGVVLKRAFKLGGIAVASAEEALLAYKQAHPVFAAFYDKAATIIAKHTSKLKPVIEKYKQLEAYADKKIDQGVGKAKEWIGSKTGPSSSVNGPRRIGQAEGEYITTTTRTSTSNKSVMRSTQTKEIAGIKVKDSEQPWTIREGQEWKGKIVGKAQITGAKDALDKAHAIAAYRKAIKEAKKADTDVILLNRGYNRIPEVNVKANRRPDVTVIKNDGKISAYEVPSKTDQTKLLQKRLEEVKDKLLERKQGEFKIIEKTKGSN